jgi:hydrogenase maturation protease
MSVVVIGVGNRFRRDDGVGPAVIDRLRALDLPGVRLADSDGEPAGLIELWSGTTTAVVVDAVHTKTPSPGRVHRLAMDSVAGDRSGAASSHGIDLGQAVELARVLGRLPDRLVVLAIEVADTGYGSGLSAAVTAAADRVAADLAEELTGRWTAPR